MNDTNVERKLVLPWRPQCGSELSPVYEGQEDGIRAASGAELKQHELGLRGYVCILGAPLRSHPPQLDPGAGQEPETQAPRVSL